MNRIVKHSFFIIMLIMAMSFCLKRTTPYVVTDAYERTDDNWIKASEISKELKFSSNKLYGFDLLIKVPDEPDSSYTTTISILSEDGSSIYEATMTNGSFIGDFCDYNEEKDFAEFIFKEPILIDRNKKYILIINTDAENDDNKLNLAIDTNGQIWERTLYQLFSASVRILLSTAFVFLACSSLYYFLFINKKTSKAMASPENVFLFGAIALGILYFLIMPIFKIPDSGNHYVRSFGIAKGFFLVPEGGILNIPRNLIPYETYTYSPYVLIHNFSNVLSKETIQHDVVNMALYSPLNYIFQSLGIFIAGIFSKNTYVLVEMGTLFNMIGCTAILYFSIKYVPYGKWVMCFLGLLPMTIQERSSLAADALSFAMVAAMVSFCLYYRDKYIKNNNSEDSILNAKAIILMYVVMLFTASCKIVYFITAGLILLIPNKAFGSKKKGIINKIIAMAALLIFSVGWLVFAQNYLGTTRGGGDTAAKIDIILHQPFRYVYILNKVFWDEGADYFLQMMGSNLGTTDVIISNLLILAGSLFMFRLVYLEIDKRKELDLPAIAFTVLQSIGMVFLVFTSLYVQWTMLSAATYTIEGIQGRYFLPIAIVLLIGVIARKDSLAAIPLNDDELIYSKERKLVLGIMIINIVCLLVSWGYTSYIG